MSDVKTDLVQSETPSSSEDVAPKRKGGGLHSIRSRIMAGVLFIIPLVVTVWLLSFVYNLALSIGVRLINWSSLALLWLLNRVVGISGDAIKPGSDTWQEGLVAALSKAAENPPKIDPSTAAWYQNLMAVILTILMLYVLGWLGTNVGGRRIIALLESLFERIPLADTVYPAVKRMVQALSGKPGEKGAQRVVLVSFPREDMKAIAFATNQIVDQTSGVEYTTVFLPTTPNPTSGYMLIVPTSQVTNSNWTMEEALSLVLSGGATAKPRVLLTTPTAPLPPTDAKPPPK